MTETKEQVGSQEQEPITIETAKVVEGIGLVFAGAVTMLEALHPHVSLEPSAALQLICGKVAGLETMGAPTAASDASAEGDTADGMAQQPVTTLTQDDITRVIVQKIKQNRSNNEKIGQLLKAHGVSKVSELPQAKYEEFLTALSAI